MGTTSVLCSVLKRHLKSKDQVDKMVKLFFMWPLTFSQGMVLFQLIMRMEAGIAIGEMLGAGVEEEDAAPVVVEGEGTVGPWLICSKMGHTTKMHLFKAVVPPFLIFLFFAYTFFKF